MQLVPRLARLEEPSRLLALQLERRTAALTYRALRLQFLEEMQVRTFHKPFDPLRINTGAQDRLPVDHPAMNGPHNTDHDASDADHWFNHAHSFLTLDRRHAESMP